MIGVLEKNKNQKKLEDSKKKKLVSQIIVKKVF